MRLQEFRKRVQAERSVRAQRDAAERRIPGERLRREIREAFARERGRNVADDGDAGTEPGPLDGRDAERG
jgi:hypothetical protein